RNAIPPTAEEDADPLEGERADGRVVPLAFASLFFVERPRPITASDRATRPLMKGLPDELGTCPSPVNPNALATALRHGRNPTKRSQTVGAVESIAHRSHGCYQTRFQRRSGSRKRLHDEAIGKVLIDARRISSMATEWRMQSKPVCSKPSSVVATTA